MTRKPTNPKDVVGSRKWRQFATVPQRVIWEIGVAMLEGALKYGRHNYRWAGVRATVYTDAAMGHIAQWVEGEDIDPDTGLSHITKAIASLVVLRDGMLQGNFNDDRPPRHDTLDAHRAWLQKRVDELLEKYPNPRAPFVDVRSSVEPFFEKENWDKALESPDPHRSDGCGGVVDMSYKI